MTGLFFTLEAAGVNRLKYYQVVYRFTLIRRFLLPIKLVYVSKWKN